MVVLMNDKINNLLFKLSMSKFRSSFHLKEKDFSYIKEKGLQKIESHAYDFIYKRLASKDILNDGGTTIYYGVGYQLIDWKIIDSEEIIKIKYKVGKELHVLRYINPLTDKPNVELEIVEEYYE